MGIEIEASKETEESLNRAKQALLKDVPLRLSTQEMIFHTSQPKPKTTTTTSTKR